MNTNNDGVWGDGGMWQLNSTQVKIAAVFDLLVVQGDRHGENVHVKQDGNIHLIDNLDKSFYYPNSLFLPQ
eukprot:304124-Pyramimonas_sp.AAC.1